MIAEKDVAEFFDYIVYYPESDEKEYDGIHDGGIKGLRQDAPQIVRQAYEKYLDMEKKAKRENIKL